MQENHRQDRRETRDRVAGVRMEEEVREAMIQDLPAGKAAAVTASREERDPEVVTEKRLIVFILFFLNVRER
jgi:hypothetical protein